MRAGIQLRLFSIHQAPFQKRISSPPFVMYRFGPRELDLKLDLKPDLELNLELDQELDLKDDLELS